MSTILSTLYQVQLYEQEIDEARNRLEAIDALLSQDTRVALAQQALEEAQEYLQDAETRHRDLELKIASLGEKIKNVDELVYGNTLKNPREVQERKQELDSLQRQHAYLQEQLKDVSSDIDSAAAEVMGCEQQLEEATAVTAEDATELEQERDTINSAMKVALKKRKKIVSDVPTATLKHYRALRKLKSGQAVAVLNGQSCGVCGIEQPSSDVTHILQRTDDIFHCIGCGRILIAP